MNRLTLIAFGRRVYVLLTKISIANSMAKGGKLGNKALQVKLPGRN